MIRDLPALLEAILNTWDMQVPLAVEIFHNIIVRYCAVLHTAVEIVP